MNRNSRQVSSSLASCCIGSLVQSSSCIKNPLRICRSHRNSNDHLLPIPPLHPHHLHPHRPPKGHQTPPLSKQRQESVRLTDPALTHRPGVTRGRETNVDDNKVSLVRQSSQTAQITELPNFD